MKTIKDKLEAIGWKCSLCSCPGQKGYDCGNAKFKGVVIKERGNSFKIIRNSLVIESALANKLEEKLKIHGLT